MLISLIVPVYNEQDELPAVLARYIAELKQICAETASEYEVIAVNDGSSDDTLWLLKDAVQLNRKVRIINFDARYGKQAAVTAGMEAAVGDCVILADIDLGNPVGVISHITEKYLEGEHIVYAYRQRSGLNRFENWLSEIFTGIAAKAFGLKGHYTGRPRFMLFSKEVTDIIVALPEKNKLLRTMDTWVGYDIKTTMFPRDKEALRNKRNKITKQKENQNRRNQNAEKAQDGISAVSQSVRRSKVREHTASLIYARTFALLTLMAVIIEIGLLVFYTFGGFFHFFAWVVIALMILVTAVTYARAMLIKRVGIIHPPDTTELYRIKNIIN